MDINGTIGEDNNMLYDNTTDPAANYDYYDIDYRAKLIYQKPDKIIALVICIAAIVLNTGSIMAICHIAGRVTPHRRFLTSLAVSDILICLNVLAHDINHVVNPLSNPHFTGDLSFRRQAYCTRVVIKGLHRASHIISLLNLMAMTLDHFLAIVKPLRYPVLMNTKRTIIIIILLWVCSFLLGYTDLLGGIGMNNLYGLIYCEYVLYAIKYDAIYLVFALSIICFVVMAGVYAVIYRIVKQHQSREMQENKKAVITTILILGTFIVCFIPATFFQSAMLIVRAVDKDFHTNPAFVHLFRFNQYLYLFMLVNSLCDPIIYAVRMRDVRSGYRRMSIKWFGSCRRRRHDDYTSVSQSTSTRTRQFDLSETTGCQTPVFERNVGTNGTGSVTVATDAC